MRDGLLAVDVDLNQVRQLKDIWMFVITGRYDLYAKKLNEYVQPGFRPHVIRDPAMTDSGAPDKLGNDPMSQIPPEL